MGKKAREKKAKQLERDRKREEGEAAARVTSDEGSSRSTAHHDTPAAADKPSTDDTQDEPAATAVSASDPTAAVGEKLRAFCDSCVQRLHDDITTWVDCEFSGDIDAVKAVAERGDAQAQYAIGFLKLFTDLSSDNGVEWLRKAVNQDNADAIFAMGVLGVRLIVRGQFPQGQEEEYNDGAKCWLTESAVEHNSANAQYIMGMLDCFLHGCARSKPDMLKTARWFRMAAHQGLKEAQWELGEWFRRGVFCDVHVPFARQYIRRAARQGHAEAIDRLKELCSCVYCGAAAAP
jgi:TPR repeat protein